MCLVATAPCPVCRRLYSLYSSLTSVPFHTPYPFAVPGQVMIMANGVLPGMRVVPSAA